MQKLQICNGTQTPVPCTHVEHAAPSSTTTTFLFLLDKNKGHSTSCDDTERWKLMTPKILCCIFSFFFFPFFLHVFSIPLHFPLSTRSLTPVLHCTDLHQLNLASNFSVYVSPPFPLHPPFSPPDPCGAGLLCGGSLVPLGGHYWNPEECSRPQQERCIQV